MGSGDSHVLPYWRSHGYGLSSRHACTLEIVVVEVVVVVEIAQCIDIIIDIEVVVEHVVIVIVRITYHA